MLISLLTIVAFLAMALAAILGFLAFKAREEGNYEEEKEQRKKALAAGLIAVCIVVVIAILKAFSQQFGISIDACAIIAAVVAIGLSAKS